ncbi:MAG: dihydrofolate reductase family protein [Bacteroidota bacterium]|nr:dihydrofolate reductase family protein [Bacteroidota bacterium]
MILYIATSLDGYIARQDGDIGWLSLVEQTGEDYGYNDFIATVDTVILGRKTYDKVLSFGIGFPHADKECYVITRSEIPPKDKITFYNKDIKELVKILKSKTGKNIFVDGGAEIVNELMRQNLIDEYIISIIPIVLGDGIRLFNGSRPEGKITLINSKQYESGLLQLHYCKVQ